MPLADHLLELAAELGALEHPQVGFENRRILVAQFVRHGLLIALNLVGRGVDGFLQPLQLLFDRIARHETPRNPKSLVVHH